MNKLYTATERDTLRNVFREVNKQQTRQLRETQWKMALVLIAVYITAFFSMFLAGASAAVVCLAVAAMYVVCRPFLKGGETADLGEDVKKLVLRPTNTPNKNGE